MVTQPSDKSQNIISIAIRLWYGADFIIYSIIDDAQTYFNINFDLWIHLCWLCVNELSCVSLLPVMVFSEPHLLILLLLGHIQLFIGQTGVVNRKKECFGH